MCVLITVLCYRFQLFNCVITALSFPHTFILFCRMNASANWRLNSSWSPSKLVKCEWKATKLWNIFFTSRVTSFSHSGFIVTLCGFCDNRVEYAWLESGETMEDLIQCRLQLFLDTAQATTMFLLHRQSLHLQIFVHLQLMLRLVLLQLVLQLNVQLQLQL